MTGTLTEDQLSQSPVLGTATEPVISAPFIRSRNDLPFAAVTTGMVMMYSPAAVTLTVYSSHSPVLVVPTYGLLSAALFQISTLSLR